MVQGRGVLWVVGRAGRQSNSRRVERACHRSGTPGTAPQSNASIPFLFWVYHRQRPQSPKDKPSHYCQTIQRRRRWTTRIPQHTGLTEGRARLLKISQCKSQEQESKESACAGSKQDTHGTVDTFAVRARLLKISQCAEVAKSLFKC